MAEGGGVGEFFTKVAKELKIFLLFEFVVIAVLCIGLSLFHLYLRGLVEDEALSFFLTRGYRQRPDAQRRILFQNVVALPC